MDFGRTSLAATSSIPVHQFPLIPSWLPNHIQLGSSAELLSCLHLSVASLPFNFCSFSFIFQILLDIFSQLKFHSIYSFHQFLCSIYHPFQPTGPTPFTLPLTHILFPPDADKKNNNDGKKFFSFSLQECFHPPTKISHLKRHRSNFGTMRFGYIPMTVITCSSDFPEFWLAS